MENRYSVYLPDTVNELKEFQKLAAMEGCILQEMEEAKTKLVQNQWILTAERDGLLRMAEMMHLEGAAELETEQLREEVLSHWSSRSPYTEFYLRDWLDRCLGEWNYRIEMKTEDYLLKLVLGLRAKGKKDFLKTHLRRIIPANLMLEISLDVNTYGDLNGLTHGQLQESGWTYGQIPYEDLTAYE